MIKFTLAALSAISLFAFVSFPTLTVASADVVKLSRSGICHGPSSPFYAKTKNFKAYMTLEDCLVYGRLPRAASNSKTSSASPTFSETGKAPYDRDAFGGWADFDRDCMNTRHELLQDLSTAVTQHTSSGCAIASGRWYDPYTDRTFYNSRDLDVDHLVPLAYAWSRGAHAWDRKTRIRFANDPANLFAVHAATNRQKGAKGPTEWMPPNKEFHCQYVLRFKRVVLTYKIQLSNLEMQRVSTIQANVCG